MAGCRDGLCVVAVAVGYVFDDDDGSNGGAGFIGV